MNFIDQVNVALVYVGQGCTNTLISVEYLAGLAIDNEKPLT